MGVHVLGQCHADAPTAAIYACGVLYPQTTVLGNGDTLHSTCVSTQAGSYLVNRTLTPPGATTATSLTQIRLAVGGPSCDVDAAFNAQAADLFEMWGLFLGVLASIWGLKAVYSLFNSYRGES